MIKIAEQEQIRQFEERLEKMREGYRGASEGVEDANRNEAIAAIEKGLRRDYLATLEEPHVGEDLNWFDERRNNAAECKWSDPGVNEGISDLQKLILVRRGLIRREAREEKIQAATEDVNRCMHVIANRAHECRLGEDIDGEYGHILLFLLEDVVRKEFGEESAIMNAAVGHMRNVVISNSTEDATK